MSRRMSVSLSLDAVHDRTKTVTRRHIDTWRTLAAGDRLTLIEKGMGLPKGAKQVVVAEVEIVGVRDEYLSQITAAEVVAEGFGPGHGDMTVEDFQAFWLAGHGYRHRLERVTDMAKNVRCRRIEWRYRP